MPSTGAGNIGKPSPMSAHRKRRSSRPGLGAPNHLTRDVSLHRNIGPANAAMAVLLRVHAEQHWLNAELLPVLRQLEAPATLSPGEFEAAIAYLEVTWSEAQRRAGATDAAHRQLEHRQAYDPD